MIALGRPEYQKALDVQEDDEDVDVDEGIDFPFLTAYAFITQSQKRP